MAVKRATFPVEVVPYGPRWAIVLHAHGRRPAFLLQPGWPHEQPQPYLFDTPPQAWGFLKKLFDTCRGMQRAQDTRLKTGARALHNCLGCGVLFRPDMWHYCRECLRRNDSLLQALGQGLYHRNRSSRETLGKLAALLEVAPGELSRHIADLCRYPVMPRKTALPPAGRRGDSDAMTWRVPVTAGWVWEAD